MNGAHPERGDFVIRGAGGGAGDDRVGFTELFVGDGRSLMVRPGWGVATEVRPTGAVAIVGSTIDSGEAIVQRAGRALLDRPMGPSIVEIADFFADVVGHFAVVVVCRGQSWVVTDHLGSIPVFVRGATRGPEVAVSTDLRRAIGSNRIALDQSSVAEFIATGRIVAPYTIDADTRRQPPATVVSLMSPAQESLTYWRPPERSRRDVEDAGEQYRTVLADILGRLRPANGRCTLMYSGGDDSRVIGAVAAQQRIDVAGVIFLDRENRELRHARSAARRSGISLEMRTRALDHDVNDLSRQATLHSPGVDLLHAHARGLIHPDRDPMPVLDGWYAALSKAENTPQTQRRWHGIPLGSARPVHDALEASLRVDEAVTERWTTKSELLHHLEPDERLEWAESYPASDDDTYGFFAFNQRSFPAVSPFALHPLVDIAGSIDADLRLNRTFFRRAFGRSIGSAAYIPRSDGEILALDSRLDLVVSAINETIYKATDRVTGRSSGPWQTNATRRDAARRALEQCDGDVIDELCRISSHARAAVDSHGQSPPSAWRWAHRTAQIAATLSPPEPEVDAE